MGAKPLRTKRKKRSKFIAGLLTLILALVVIIAILLVVLYKGLERYESTTPRSAIDSYFKQLAAGDYEKIKENAGFTPDEVNTWDAYFEFLNQEFGDDPSGFYYRQVAGTGGEGTSYAVYQGEERLGEVVLTESPSEKSGYAVRAALDFLEPFKVTAPGDVTVLVNGSELPKTGEDVAVTPNEMYAELPEAEQPTRIEYTLGKSLEEPVITAKGPDGAECEVVVDKEKHTASVSLPFSEDLRQRFATEIEGASKAYALFISEDGSFATLNTYLYPGTQFASDLSSFAAIWYADHTSYSFDNLAVKDIVMTSPTTFEGDITYDFTIMFQGTPKVYATHHHMAFAQYGDDWLMVNMESLKADSSG